MDARAIEGGVGARNWNQIHQSISMNDFLALLSDQANCENNPEFEDMKQLLLSDAQAETSDEKCVMSKVNSFYNLLQTAANDGKEIGLDNNNNNKRCNKTEEGGIVLDHASSSMSRKDSFSDLLAHLPRITSLPKFLFNISEEDGDA